MSADADGSFFSLLISVGTNAVMIKAAVVMVLFGIVILLSLFCGSVSTASQTEIKKAADHGDKKSKKAAALLDKEDIYTKYAHMGITAFGGLYLIAVQLLGDPLLMLALGQTPLRDNAVLSGALCSGVIFLLSFFLLSVFGISLPEKAGRLRAEGMLSGMAGIFSFLLGICVPLSALSDLLSDIILRPDEKNTKDDANRRAEEEILQMVDEGEENGVIEGNTKDMIENILDFDDITVGEIMTHRKDVVAVKQGTEITKAACAAIESGKSRLPVYGDDIDDIVGILYVKDLLKYVSTGVPDEKIEKEMLKEAVFVPESKRCSEMFEYMTENKTQIAVVVDEFGGTGGIITMEDLIESIVGNIQDEYDNEAEEIEKVDERSFTVSGSTSLDEISELTGLDFEDEQDDTVAGIMLDRMGHIPKSGEHPSIMINGTRFTVQEVEDRRISKVLIVKAV